MIGHCTFCHGETSTGCEFCNPANNLRVAAPNNSTWDIDTLTNLLPNFRNGDNIYIAAADRINELNAVVKYLEKKINK